MTQPEKRPLMHSLMGVPKRLFASDRVRPTPKAERITSVGEVVFTHKPVAKAPRLSPATAPTPKAPQATAIATDGPLALKRRWPSPNPENLFRDDFDI